MKLSVLIPCVPSRTELALLLFEELQRQIGTLPVEVLLLLDNKKRSVGKKRETLVQAAHGEYVAFVDDDDWIAETYIESILPATLSRPDVIVFNTLSSLNGKPYVRAQHSLKFDNEEFNENGFKRKPWQMHAWRRGLAQAYRFPDVNYGEDWGWCSQLCEEARQEVLVPGDLYLYRYSDDKTEAKP